MSRSDAAKPKPRSPGAAGPRADYILSLALAGLAGSVDAIGFVSLYGLFVSFMSGNSTVLGVEGANLDGGKVALSLALIACFVLGVVVGELLTMDGGRYARATVLSVEAALLAACTGMAHAGVTHLVVGPMLGVAMGIQNGAVHKAGGITIASTYVTGTLVNAGRGFAHAVAGEGAWSAPLPFLGLWCSLVTGSAIGAVATRRSFWEALAGAASSASLLAAIVAATAWRRGAVTPVETPS